MSSQVSFVGRPPLRFHAGPLVLGGVLVAIGLYVALVVLPPRDFDRAAASAIDDQRLADILLPIASDQKFIHPDDMAILYPSAWGLAGFGAVIAIVGTVRRAKLAYCAACAGTVVVKPGSFNVRKKCERCGSPTTPLRRHAASRAAKDEAAE